MVWFGILALVLIILIILVVVGIVLFLIYRRTNNQPTICTQDSQCRSGYFCVSGECKAGPDMVCSSNSDCAPNLTCSFPTQNSRYRICTDSTTTTAITFPTALLKPPLMEPEEMDAISSPPVDQPPDTHMEGNDDLASPTLTMVGTGPSALPSRVVIPPMTPHINQIPLATDSRPRSYYAPQTLDDGVHNSIPGELQSPAPLGLSHHEVTTPMTLQQPAPQGSGASIPLLSDAQPRQSIRSTAGTITGTLLKDVQSPGQPEPPSQLRSFIEPVTPPVQMRTPAPKINTMSLATQPMVTPVSNPRSILVSREPPLSTRSRRSKAPTLATTTSRHITIGGTQLIPPVVESTVDNTREVFEVVSDPTTNISTPCQEVDGACYCQSEHKVIDVCSYSDANLYLLSNGMITYEPEDRNNARRRIGNNVKLEKITSYSGYMYGLSAEGQLHTLSNNYLNTDQWNWTPVEWCSYHLNWISGSLDGSILWVQNEQRGYIYDSPGHLLDEVNIEGRRRVYGRDINKYLEIDREGRVHIPFKNQVLTHVYDAALTYYDEVVTVNSPEYRAVKLINWKPYYIKV